MPLRRSVALLVVLGGAFAALPSTGSAYHFHANKWPNGVVPYYNAAPDQAWAVASAVRAWNQSGAHVRFVAVPRAKAGLVIEEQANKVYCLEGHASLGHVPGAHVVIFPAHGITIACNRYWAARVMTHELGHVLGLLHEDRSCASMNATGSMRGGLECGPTPVWDWRCRLLEPDDVAGVAAVYGGKARPAVTPELCPLYAAIKPPRSLRAAFDPVDGAVTLSFTRPAAATIPSFVASARARQREAFAITTASSTCSAPDAGAGAPRYLWHAKVGDVERIMLPAVSGDHCYSVWAVDRFGRASDIAATLSVRVE
jgi:hypothetical protein